MATAKATKAAKGKQLLALVALALLVVGIAPQQLEAARHLPGVDVESAVIELQRIDTSDDPKPLTVDATSIHPQPSHLATAFEHLPSLAALSASTTTNRRFRLLDPPAVGAWGENLASGGLQPLSERMSLARHAFRWESRIADYFLQPDPLGPIDSTNLYQAFNFDPFNFTDPPGLSTLYGMHLQDLAGAPRSRSARDLEELGRGSSARTMATLSNPYVQGSMQIAGGCASAAVGAAGVVAPEPTTSVAGWAAVAYGSDLCAAGFRTILSGQAQRTLTNQGLQLGYEGIGMAPEDARRWADSTELLAAGLVDVTAARRALLTRGLHTSRPSSTVRTASGNAMTVPAARIRVLREALSDSNGRLLSRLERQGLKESIRAIEGQGYRLGGSVKYRGNEGIDLFFEGVGDNVGRIALAEAKAGSGLGRLVSDSLGIRQGSYEFFRTRLARGIAWGDPAKRALYRSLYGSLRSGQADLFGYFAGNRRLYLFDPGLFPTSVNFRSTPGAAIRVP
jgi:hypothetical protein